MKRLLPFFLVIALSLSGCSGSASFNSIFGTYDPIEYNNRIVEKVNEHSAVLQESATLYNDMVPDVVTEKDTIETETMALILEDLEDANKASQKLLNYESRDLEQQAAVREAMDIYLLASEQYELSYTEMLTYYQEGLYVDDISLVEPLDARLHEDYTTFIEANNELVDTLESFMDA